MLTATHWHLCADPPPRTTGTAAAQQPTIKQHKRWLQQHRLDTLPPITAWCTRRRCNASWTPPAGHATRPAPHQANMQRKLHPTSYTPPAADATRAAPHLKSAMTLSSISSTSPSLAPLSPLRSLSSMNRLMNSGLRCCWLMNASNDCARQRGKACAHTYQQSGWGYKAQ
jgi:hypothetical protein